MESVARGTRSDSVSIALWRLPHASGLSGPFSMSVVRGPHAEWPQNAPVTQVSPSRGRGMQTRPGEERGNGFG